MLRLHYVPGGHGSHNFGHGGRNGVTVTQRRGTGSTKVARRSYRDRRDRFLNSQKICHDSHGGIDLLKCAVNSHQFFFATPEFGKITSSF